jgi:hypothetical protein
MQGIDLAHVGERAAGRELVGRQTGGSTDPRGGTKGGAVDGGKGSTGGA